MAKLTMNLSNSVILAAPKGSGRTVRSLFREGRGINSSVAVYQDVTGKAEEKVIALGVAIGSGYLYKTTFEKEVFSDLYGGEKVSSSRLPICAVVCAVKTSLRARTISCPWFILQFLPHCSNTSAKG